MKTVGLNEIRTKFLAFFEKNDHMVHPSFPLIPQSDKSLLLVSAGMVPFKDYFMGVVTPPSPRMVTCQKCIRTTDIDNVGNTARHASFFEMLGNFSFGDYFKSRAIALAWRFLTEELALSKEKLWVTVYLDDDEAYRLWHEQEGVAQSRIVRLGKEDNFWEIGSGTGPCGPCSEIYVDRGETYGCGQADCKPGCECDRFMEVWNLVFTQFNQTEDGQYIPLENPNIDTGMGLERIATIMQGVDSIFDIDVMVEIRNRLCQLADVRYGENAKRDVSIRKIVDHIRAVTFLVSDGVTPHNEGRGYVLRRLLRRAARHGKLLGIESEFLYKLAQSVIDIFGEAYPELAERADYTVRIIKIEEERFASTIEQGLTILESYIAELEASNQRELSGELAFKLYDTYGFPLDLTLEIVSEMDLSVDRAAFAKAMELQRQRARDARKATGWQQGDMIDLSDVESQFVGYDHRVIETQITAIIVDGTRVERARAESSCTICLAETPFYAESGGQRGDVGLITADQLRLIVNDTKKDKSGMHMMECQLIQGTVAVGNSVKAEVSAQKRLAIARNHSATHLLHQALKDVLGDHVKQAGSLVDSDRLRFDFNHFHSISSEQLQKIDDLVNEIILQDLPISVEEMPLDQAQQRGATALFGEKYGSIVRVVSMGDYSVELCGGTHLMHTAQIGLFKIMSESGIAAGVRRIEAITGQAVNQLLKRTLSERSSLASLLKTTPNQLDKAVQQLIDDNKALSQQLEKIKQQSANRAADQLLANAEQINGVAVIRGKFVDQKMDVLRKLADELSEGKTARLVVLANQLSDKVNFISKANQAAVDQGIHCGNIVRELAKVTGGGGGGRADMAQAGGKDVTKLDEALQLLEDLV